jgi:hypothetical protein
MKKSTLDAVALSSILLGLLVWIAVFLSASCGTGPTPVPNPPVPAPTPSVDPRFTGFHDCAFVDTSQGVGMANTCATAENPAECFSGYADQGANVALLLCSARDIQSAGFVDIARGTAGPEQTVRARRLREWLASTNATLRDTP